MSVEELLELEAERCRALSEQDWDTLERLLPDDLTHTHMNGRTEDRATYLEGVKRSPRTVRRENLSVRLFGDVGVMTGRMINSRNGEDVEASVLQVWVRRDGQWQQAAFQASRVTAPGA
jgi:hypothetical protein